MDPISVTSLSECESALYKLTQATLTEEAKIADRDKEIAVIQHRYAPAIERAAAQKVALGAAIEAYYREHRSEIEVDGKKSLQLHSGVIGMRAPSNPALIPLNDKWSWERITDMVKELFGAKKFFHPPKPPALDKTKIKKALDEKALAGCGLKLDTEERFYYDLNRLKVADEQTVEAA